ncbi:MAG: hypothetical protein AAF657_00705 [Acidobacteriota bacterium]
MEAGLKAAIERVLPLIEDDCAWVDALEDRIESLWLHFDWLEAHHRRLCGLRNLSGDLERLAEGEETEGDLLASLPILCVGQSADLIIESKALRVWLSRVPEEELAVELKLEEKWREVWRGRKVC